jgi:hypothetical protein
MPERVHGTYDMGKERAQVRVARVGKRQRGRITRAQLLALGVSDRVIQHWLGTGYLFRVLPHVYAVGHPGRSEEADLFAAVLYAGPGAGLRGMTAGLWRGLVKWRTEDAIEVSSPHRRRSLAANDPRNALNRTVVVHHQPGMQRRPYHGIPTVPIPQIVLGLAAGGDLQLVRFVLAQLDFMRILNPRALEQLCGRGVPGSAVLRQGLANQLPLLARARSPSEVRLVAVCEMTGIPLPELNEEVGPVVVDAVWWDEMVVVECDGRGNHGTWAQRARDVDNEVSVRGLGFQLIRYTDRQLADPWGIHADLMPILRERAGRAQQLRAA